MMIESTASFNLYREGWKKGHHRSHGIVILSMYCALLSEQMSK